MVKSGILLITFWANALNVEAQTKQTTNMENKFNEQQKEVFSTIETMVTAFQNKDIDGVLATYEKKRCGNVRASTACGGKRKVKRSF
jgi:hypothetical protein